MKYCPFKYSNPNISPYDWRCEHENCALWNERFLECALAVDAYLKGHEDWRKEKEIARRVGRYDLP